MLRHWCSWISVQVNIIKKKHKAVFSMLVELKTLSMILSKMLKPKSTLDSKKNYQFLHLKTKSFRNKYLKKSNHIMALLSVERLNKFMVIFRNSNSSTHNNNNMNKIKTTNSFSRSILNRNSLTNNNNLNSNSFKYHRFRSNPFLPSQAIQNKLFKKNTFLSLSSLKNHQVSNKTSIRWTLQN